MKEMCAEERPREKMLAKGAGAMSNAELLAILIGLTSICLRLFVPVKNEADILDPGTQVTEQQEK